MAKKHTAQCACGTIKFEFETDPTFIAVCHCRDCKKASGDEAATFVGVPENDIHAGQRRAEDVSLRRAVGEAAPRLGKAARPSPVREHAVLNIGQTTPATDPATLASQIELARARHPLEYAMVV